MDIGIEIGNIDEYQLDTQMSPSPTWDIWNLNVLNFTRFFIGSGFLNVSCRLRCERSITEMISCPTFSNVSPPQWIFKVLPFLVTFGACLIFMFLQTRINVAHFELELSSVKFIGLYFLNTSQNVPFSEPINWILQFESRLIGPDPPIFFQAVWNIASIFCFYLTPVPPGNVFCCWSPLKIVISGYLIYSSPYFPQHKPISRFFFKVWLQQGALSTYLYLTLSFEHPWDSFAWKIRAGQQFLKCLNQSLKQVTSRSKSL